MKLKWQYIFAAMVLVYALNQAFGWAYMYWSWIDIPMHIIGGFLTATLGLSGWQLVRAKQKLKPLPPYAIAIFMISFTALIAVLWECHEFALDAWHFVIIKDTAGYSPMQPSLADTMKDLADGLIGACLSVLVFNKQLE